MHDGERAKMSLLSAVRLQLLVAVTVFLLLTVSCASTNMSSGTGEDNVGPTPVTATPFVEDSARTTATTFIITPMVSDPDPLHGTRWHLVAFEKQGRSLEIPQQPEPIVIFRRGALGFEAGCNDIIGYYLVEDHRMTVTFSERTEMDCSSNLGVQVNEIEEAFFTAMQTFDSYALEDGRLRIDYAKGTILLRRVR